MMGWRFPPLSFTFPSQTATSCQLSLLSFPCIDLMVQREQYAAVEIALCQTKLNLNAGSGTFYIYDLVKVNFLNFLIYKAGIITPSSQCCCKKEINIV